MDGVHFLHADKHQNSYKLVLSLLMKVTRHDQITQNRKLGRMGVKKRFQALYHKAF